MLALVVWHPSNRKLPRRILVVLEALVGIGTNTTEGNCSTVSTNGGRRAEMQEGIPSLKKIGGIFFLFWKKFSSQKGIPSVDENFPPKNIVPRSCIGSIGYCFNLFCHAELQLNA